MLSMVYLDQTEIPPNTRVFVQIARSYGFLNTNYRMTSNFSLAIYRDDQELCKVSDDLIRVRGVQLDFGRNESVIAAGRVELFLQFQINRRLDYGDAISLVLPKFWRSGGSLEGIAISSCELVSSSLCAPPSKQLVSPIMSKIQTANWLEEEEKLTLLVSEKHEVDESICVFLSSESEIRYPPSGIRAGASGIRMRLLFADGKQYDVPIQTELEVPRSILSLEREFLAASGTLSQLARMVSLQLTLSFALEQGDGLNLTLPFPPESCEAAGQVELRFLVDGEEMASYARAELSYRNTSQLDCGFVNCRDNATANPAGRDTSSSKCEGESTLVVWMTGSVRANVPVRLDFSLPLLLPWAAVPSSSDCISIRLRSAAFPSFFPAPFDQDGRARVEVIRALGLFPSSSLSFSPLLPGFPSALRLEMYPGMSLQQGSFVEVKLAPLLASSCNVSDGWHEVSDVLLARWNCSGAALCLSPRRNVASCNALSVLFPEDLNILLPPSGLHPNSISFTVSAEEVQDQPFTLVEGVGQVVSSVGFEERRFPGQPSRVLFNFTYSELLPPNSSVVLRLNAFGFRAEEGADCQELPGEEARRTCHFPPGTWQEDGNVTCCLLPLGNGWDLFLADISSAPGLTFLLFRTSASIAALEPVSLSSSPLVSLLLPQDGISSVLHPPRVQVTVPASPFSASSSLQPVTQVDSVGFCRVSMDISNAVAGKQSNFLLSVTCAMSFAPGEDLQFSLAGLVLPPELASNNCSSSSSSSSRYFPTWEQGSSTLFLRFSEEVAAGEELALCISNVLLPEDGIPSKSPNITFSSSARNGKILPTGGWSAGLGSFELSLLGFDVPLAGTRSSSLLLALTLNDVVLPGEELRLFLPAFTLLPNASSVSSSSAAGPAASSYLLDKFGVSDVYTQAGQVLDELFARRIFLGGAGGEQVFNVSLSSSSSGNATEGVWINLHAMVHVAKKALVIVIVNSSDALQLPPTGIQKGHDFRITSEAINALVDASPLTLFPLIGHFSEDSRFSFKPAWNLESAPMMLSISLSLNVAMEAGETVFLYLNGFQRTMKFCDPNVVGYQHICESLEPSTCLDIYNISCNSSSFTLLNNSYISQATWDEEAHKMTFMLDVNISANSYVDVFVPASAGFILQRVTEQVRILLGTTARAGRVIGEHVSHGLVRIHMCGVSCGGLLADKITGVLPSGLDADLVGKTSPPIPAGCSVDEYVQGSCRCLG
uniref:Uncharacterized protein n=1 Tax=Hanusia phi TaxID=3032 RepID=A0A7S0F0B2_9CRYP